MCVIIDVKLWVIIDLGEKKKITEYNKNTKSISVLMCAEEVTKLDNEIYVHRAKEAMKHTTGSKVPIIHKGS